ncbi:unnamed protein product [Vitrella brassicaformis CCMP3155]|uniref:Tyrosine-protein kinase ephrin type A/B receptor-like domain-containing protein n=2 Tax=Vitrella brassicaformis TaxID=1169539 RepID=A0A0G4EUT8_VITBC|nr:unnamed protein product [Vitrella brassicaformis CCMP3155]|eukprot:CEM02219.1 unnamed protein product [Vitrella brassicaformis CCMP3155]
MRIPWFCFFAALSWPPCVHAQTNLTLLGIFSHSDPGAPPPYLRHEPIISKALDEVNADPRYLPGHTLQMQIIEPQECTTDNITRSTLMALQNNQDIVGIFGDSCLIGCETLSAIAEGFNRLAKSYYCQRPPGADYRFIVSTLGPSTQWVSVMGELAKAFKWNRFYLVTETYDDPLVEAMQAELQRVGVAEPNARTWVFETPGEAYDRTLAELLQHRPRVIVYNTKAPIATGMTCAFARAGITHKNKDPDSVQQPPVLIGLLDRGDDFNASPCTKEDLEPIVWGEMHFYAPVWPHLFAGSISHTFSGKDSRTTFNEFMGSCFASSPPVPCDPFRANYVYDTVWEWAVLLHEWFDSGNTLADLENPNRTTLDWFWQENLNLNYVGFSQAVSYLSNGDRASDVIVFQTFGADQQASDFDAFPFLIGSFATGSYIWPPPNYLGPIQWPDGTFYWGFNSSGTLFNSTPPVCPEGHYVNTTGRCVPCPVGEANDQVDQWECEPCQDGFYQNKTGQSECDICPTGQFSKPHAVDCTLCEPGSYQDLVAQSECNICPVGSFSNTTGAKECILCPPGTYQPDLNSTRCLSCLATKTTARIGSRSIDERTCVEGMFLDIKNDRCISCDSSRYTGLDCVGTGGMYQLPLLQQNYWAEIVEDKSDFSDIEVYRCLEVDACPGP